MSKTKHHEPQDKPSPRKIKREKQRRAMWPEHQQSLPLPDPPRWKPLG